jgi:5-methyltetrahydropteroyltriglutamate--homocysteine methyltransferase
MGRYARYSTTVIGAYSVSDWFEPLDRLLAVGQLSMASMADAQFRAGQAAVLDQELAGIDVVTGGEMHRRTHNRHSPPNAMLNHFWQKIPAFRGSTRPKPITAHDPDVFHPAATCKERAADDRQAVHLSGIGNADSGHPRPHIVCVISSFMDARGW